MTLKEIREALISLDLSPTEKLVLVGLMLYSDINGSCWPSFSSLAKLTGLTRRGVINAINRLEQKQIISRKQRGTKTNIYLFNTHFIKSSGSEPDSPALVNHVHQGSEPHSLGSEPHSLGSEPHSLGSEPDSPALVNHVHPKNTIEGDKEDTIEGTKEEREYSARAKSSLVEIPSLDEVKGYAVTIGLPPQEAEAFHDYYSARGWELKSGQPMRDWQAALRSWKRHWMEREQTVGKAKANQPVKPNPWWGLSQPGDDDDDEWRF